MKRKDSNDFLFFCSWPKDHNNGVIEMFIMFLKPDVQSVSFNLENKKNKVCLFEMVMVNVSARDDGRAGCGRTGQDGTAEQKSLEFPV